MKLTNKYILFTGATSGIGKIAAIELASQGHNVVVTYRNETKAKLLLTELSNKKEVLGSIELLKCDLSSLQSIDNACEEYISKYNQLDILVNNAGLWNNTLKDSKDGIEETFAVNVLAPIFFVQKLTPLLKKASDPKIINTASALHQGEIDFDDIEFKKKKFSGFQAYRQSKLALILYTRLLAKKLSNSPIEVYSNHPGMVATDIARSSGTIAKFVFKLLGKSPEKGAETLIYLATKGKSHLTNGEYYVNKKVSKTTDEANNLDTAEKLLRIAEEYQQNYRSLAKEKA